MKKLKKNQLKLDKEVISSLSENELSVVKGGVNTEPLTRCLDGRTICMAPAPSIVFCFSDDKTECCPINLETQKCIVNPEPSCNVCELSVEICRYTDKC